ncbi:vanillate O-demethylase ferredoxin subunit [Microbacterium ginsengiterrae]|uniref:Vanillate O-demethylase ferredoxin subunit n=1 Tax=Microbacterium ginsengiterrae TaxID=546115 RepID=A0A7W9CBH3_9MICO|nr:PDR/VanB family oxidoreductase [Microbacterium ginsengiterrae]MBB5742545.1 vanillate O-demethylase ferredoxin subunit [Microbacterium ginsengiterrae]
MATSHTLAWQFATVVECAPVTDRIRRIVLAPDDPQRIDPGAHVEVRMRIGAEPTTRSYSIAEVADDGSFALCIHRSDVSRGGAAVMHALRPGDRVEATHPLQDFPFSYGGRSYAFLAGGVGITALRGMMTAARTTGKDYRIAYCGRSRTQMAYLDALTAEHGDRLQAHVRDEGTSIDVRAFVAALEDDVELYMCGPIRLMDAVRRAWDDAGRPPANLRFETFGNSGWFQPEPFLVRIPASGIECVVSPTQTLLEALEGAGADAMFDCRKGECGICEARVVGLDGDIDHRDVFYSERQRDAKSKLCPCVSRVRASGGAEMATVELELS